MAKKSIKRRKGTLFIIAGLLLASGVFRLTGGVGQAVAREFEEFGASEVHSGTCVADLEPVLDAIRQRENTVAAREEELAVQLQKLSLAKAEIEKNFNALIAAEAELAATLTQVETSAETDLSKLTAVYESMKPKDAAALFEEMAPEFAAGFLSRMRSDTAADIMAGLKPQTAYTISVLLAGRNANLPKE
ncbi:MotE family protein [Parasulfitobacter algicola]|uniref:Magnesium transporter MgtE intracellular domain-containing protein n=1 Tax=Parasulfitobacter algicola TaxID=2614809 RepID=A0ABX2IP64_9RHOB|nr:hypothetical protein [Sulfitobacter algicola]NSX54663.1 hypothetical protein [Sulfitobacter algicola]